MPKKFQGENSKSAQARARKEEKKVAEITAKQQAIEDEYWKEDDKHVLRKQQRKDDKEKKRQEQLDKKKEKEKLYEEELQAIKSAKAKVDAKEKVTRAEIEAHKEKVQAEHATIAEKKLNMSEKLVADHESRPIEENVNRMEVEGDAARSVDEAIAVLSIKEPSGDRHPERRVKAAYQAFEERELPILKQENPNMRLSQLRQLLKKEWQKSPENPLNQKHILYNFRPEKELTGDE